MRTLGIERECFITENSIIVPKIGKLLNNIYKVIGNNSLCAEQFSYELFAGQIEDRSKVASDIDGVLRSLKNNKAFMKKIGGELGMNFLYVDYIEELSLGELKVNPFNKRHQTIWLSLSHEKKVAASQVAAIHVHISVNIKEAVKVLNYCRKDIIDQLATLGDFSNGKRLKAYRTMAKVYGDSPLVTSAESLLNYINQSGGEKNVWDMVRYKLSTTTIEFRMFGTTCYSEKIAGFLKASQEIVEQAVRGK